MRPLDCCDRWVGRQPPVLTSAPSVACRLVYLPGCHSAATPRLRNSNGAAPVRLIRSAVVTTLGLSLFALTQYQAFHSHHWTSHRLQTALHPPLQLCCSLAVLAISGFSKLVVSGNEQSCSRLLVRSLASCRPGGGACCVGKHLSVMDQCQVSGKMMNTIPDRL